MAAARVPTSTLGSCAAACRPARGNRNSPPEPRGSSPGSRTPWGFVHLPAVEDSATLAGLHRGPLTGVGGSKSPPRPTGRHPGRIRPRRAAVSVHASSTSGSSSPSRELEPKGSRAIRSEGSTGAARAEFASWAPPIEASGGRSFAGNVNLGYGRGTWRRGRPWVESPCESEKSGEGRYDTCLNPTRALTWRACRFSAQRTGAGLALARPLPRDGHRRSSPPPRPHNPTQRRRWHPPGAKAGLREPEPIDHRRSARSTRSSQP